ncbi:MAG: hypothetical protein IKG69_07065 [Atopobiaceae bacterium]|nr:hypothetical protein [Atopobiaceae bacterium]MBR3384945.1 hypothetical protein [Atopobiaceae bacterium]
MSSMGVNPLYSGFTPEQMMMCSLEEGYGQYYNLREFNGAHTSGGRGLTYPKRLTQALGGKMWVVSHGYALEVSEHGTSMLEGLYYPGTLISMRLPVRDGDRLLASDMFTNGPEVPITWNPQEGWVDHLGRQVDVDGVRGADDGLW